jgi:hypothetical protein
MSEVVSAHVVSVDGYITGLAIPAPDADSATGRRPSIGISMGTHPARCSTASS